MSREFTTVGLPDRPTVTAPDGSEVRVLAATARGSMAQFRLKPGEVSAAVVHRSVEELWYVTRGRGRLWRARDGAEETVALQPGISLAILPGTRFQFRCDGEEPLEIAGVTMPPWPGPDEAERVQGMW